jgi:hypothetical protein
MDESVSHNRVTPIDEEVTSWFPASTVRLGLEYRFITPESVQRARDRNPGVDLDLSTQEGWSLHVLGSDDGREYLRFDCFPSDPHYHFLLPTGPDEEPTHYVFKFDPTVDGEMWEWSKRRLRTELPEMLRRASAGHLVDRLDIDAVERAVQAADDKVRAVRASVST